ncbi:MAG: flagellar biosynthesis protein FlhB [Planctomycetota bacterium]
MPEEEAAAERTEEATPRKREQARERGQVAHSRDLSAAVVVFAGVLLLRFGGFWLVGKLGRMAEFFLEETPLLPVPGAEEGVAYAPQWMGLFCGIVAPVLLTLFVIAAAAGVVQVGFVLSAEPLTLRFDKLNPAAGLRRLFNLRSFMTLVMSLFKVGVVVAVAYYSFRSELFHLDSMGDLEARAVMIHMAQAVMNLMLRLAAVLLVLALADMWYHRYQWEQDLRMTKQELREELRDTEGDPYIRSRRRQIQRHLAQQRMMAEVPSAEVVVRNPSHYAVALGYDWEKQSRPPYVIAKGKDRVAERIIEIAARHNIPMRYEPDLARRLYRELEVGDSIPEELFRAVADVLAWVYRKDSDRAERIRRARAA